MCVRVRQQRDGDLGSRGGRNMEGVAWELEENDCVAKEQITVKLTL